MAAALAEAQRLEEERIEKERLEMEAAMDKAEAEKKAEEAALMTNLDILVAQELEANRAAAGTRKTELANELDSVMASSEWDEFLALFNKLAEQRQKMTQCSEPEAPVAPELAAV